MSGTGYVGSSAFAEIADISRQAAAKIMARAICGEQWRGYSLDVRRSKSRGGRSGLIYEVSINSLSQAVEGLQAAASEAATDLPALLTVSTHALISKALIAPTRKDRGVIIKATAEATKKTTRTVQRTIAKVRKGGVVAALRKKPSNAGKPRVAISRKFTRFAMANGWTPDQAWTVHSALKNHVRALWIKQAANAGWKIVARLAREKLARDLPADLTETMTPAVARTVLDVPRRFVESERRRSLLNRKQTDAKAHYDARPGTLLDLNACGPMELVYGDVHHLDVKMRRIDGEAAFCVKMVAFMDAGNRRVFARFYNMPKGRMIRQEHVAETFALMACHPEYGMPGTLYIDNGSEYKMMDHMANAFQLMEAGGYRGTLIHSKAYNPHGKAALESFFKHFERYYLSMLPGYAGGDRQRQKTANQGREIKVADWSADEAERVLYALLDRYNADERATLGDRTPIEVFSASAVHWCPVTVSMEALAFGHAKRQTRTVRQGLIKVNGKSYRLSGPTALAETVTVMLSPWMQNGIVVEYDGKLVCAPLALKHHPLDRAGALDAARHGADFDREIVALGTDLPNVNPLAELLHDRPAMLDLIAGPKGAFRQALSPKARRESEQREDAAVEAIEHRKADIISQANRGANARRIKAA